MKPRNILHVVTSLEDGGLEKVVYILISKIKDVSIQHHCAILLRKKSRFLEQEFIQNGVLLTEYDFENKGGSLSVIIKNIKELFRLAKYIENNNISIIHSHDFFPAFISRSAAIISFLFYFYKTDRIIITLHNTMYWLSSFHHFINRLLSHITGTIVCVSQSVKDYSLGKDRIKESKYLVIYNGVNVDEYTPDSTIRSQYLAEFNLSNEDIVIGNVGVLSPRKGQKYLLNAYSRLIKEHKNLKLLIFGSRREHENETADEIFNLINSLGLSEKVRVINPRKDLNKIYNIFDLFVMPSITEGLSLSAVEAMLMEKICLFSDIPPFREMIEEGKNGFLFRSQDEDDLYTKMNFIITNIRSLESTGKTARNDALKKYDSIRMAEEYRSLYLGNN